MSKIGNWLDKPLPRLSFLGGFKGFVLRGNVVDLATGIIIGAAFTAVVNGLVTSIITPLIPLPTGSLADLAWMPPYGHTLVRWGTFTSTVINFFIVASVVYFLIVKPMKRLLPPKPTEEVWD